MIITRKNYAVSIDDETGNIAEFYGKTGINYLEKPVPLADLTFIKEGGERVWLSTGKAVSVTEKGGVVTVRYEKVGGCDLNVTAKLDCSDDTFLKARLQFENHTGMKAESVRFPNVLLKNRLGVNGYKLFWPAMEGVEIYDENFRNELMSYNDGTVFPAKGWEGVYPGACPMQFMAYYNGEHGFYYASHDEDANLKLVEWKPEDGGIRLIMQMFPAAPFDEVYEYRSARRCTPIWRRENCRGSSKKRKRSRGITASAPRGRGCTPTARCAREDLRGSSGCPLRAARSIPSPRAVCSMPNRRFPFSKKNSRARTAGKTAPPCPRRSTRAITKPCAPSRGKTGISPRPGRSAANCDFPGTVQRFIPRRTAPRSPCVFAAGCWRRSSISASGAGF